MSRFTGRVKRLVASGKLAAHDLKGNAYLVLLTLAFHADKEGRVTITQEQLVEETQRARSTIRTALDQLIAADIVWVERRGEGRAATTYRIITDHHLPSRNIPAPTRTAVYDANTNGFVVGRELGQQAITPVPVVGRELGQQTPRSWPSSVPTTNSPESVVGRELGQQDPVVGRELGQQVKETRYARETVTTPTLAVAHDNTPVATPTKQDNPTHTPVLGGVGATAPTSPTQPTDDLRWGWKDTLGRAEWDEYAPLYKQVYGRELHPEDTIYFPGAENYTEALTNLQKRAHQ